MLWNVMAVALFNLIVCNAWDAMIAGAYRDAPPYAWKERHFGKA